MRAEQAARHAPMTLAISKPRRPGESRCWQAKPKASSGSLSECAPNRPRFIMTATISPTSAQPIVHRRLAHMPWKNPTRQVYSSLPVPTAARMCGCAMMPTMPLIVSITMNHGPTSLGVAREKLMQRQGLLHPARPPTAPQPSGISMKERKISRKPCTKLLQAEATRPPTKL